MRIRDALRLMIEQTDTADACADAIAEHEGWALTEDQARDRVRQCLRKADRNFDVDWQPIVLAIVGKAGGPDLVTGLLDQARRDGEYARMQQEPDGLFHAAERERFSPAKAGLVDRARARVEGKQA